MEEMTPELRRLCFRAGIVAAWIDGYFGGYETLVACRKAKYALTEQFLEGLKTKAIAAGMPKTLLLGAEAEATEKATKLGLI